MGLVRLGRPLDENQIQPASLDLRLGEWAYRVRASFLPGPARTVAQRLEQLRLHRFPLQDGAVFETGCVYIVPLLESLQLPQDIAALANPKSSTGRLDIFTRVIADRAREFDRCPRPMKVRSMPRSAHAAFPILARTGSRLSQIRFRRGAHAASDEIIAQLHADEGSDLGARGQYRQWHRAVGRPLRRAVRRSRSASAPSDMPGLIDVDRVGALEVARLSGSRSASAARSSSIPDQFYILASKEAVRVPPTHAAEMVPFNPLVGEFRVHYAGFFDPGFGHQSGGGEGARAVLEVRSHEVPFILEDGQIIGRLIYEPLTEAPSASLWPGHRLELPAPGTEALKAFQALSRHEESGRSAAAMPMSSLLMMEEFDRHFAAMEGRRGEC